jgi:hypothetical protein
VHETIPGRKQRKKERKKKKGRRKERRKIKEEETRRQAESSLLKLLHRACILSCSLQLLKCFLERCFPCIPLTPTS